MKNSIDIEKQLLCPPGLTIQETIDALDMSQAELAERMGRPKEKINELIKGKIALSTDTAFQLERVLGIPSSFWLNMEREYRDELYKIHRKEKLENNISWLKEFPVAYLQKLKILPDSKDKGALVEHLLSFFRIASPEQWFNIYIHNSTAVSFRISLENTTNPGAITAWLRYCELQAENLVLKPFDKSVFKAKLIEIRNKTDMLYDNTLDFIVNQCATAGVAVIYTPLFPKSSISGATRWIADKPTIQLTDKYKTDDQFWFTFFHEAGHILLHGKKDVFLEGLETDKDKEDEADKFAMDILIPPKSYNEFLRHRDFSEQSIVAFAKALKISTGVVVGRLQHDKHLPYNQLNHLKRKLTFANEETSTNNGN